MKKIIVVAMLSFVLFGCGSKDGKFVTEAVSPYSLDQSVQKVQNELVDKNYTIQGVIDNSALSGDDTLALKGQKLLTFTNDEVAAKLLSCNPAMGMEIPLKIVVWKDYEGKVHVAFINPEYWSLSYNIKDKSCITTVANIKSDMNIAVKNALKR